MKDFKLHMCNVIDPLNEQFKNGIHMQYAVRNSGRGGDAMMATQILYMWTWSRDHNTHDAVLSSNTALHFGRPSKIQQYSNAMCGTMENNGFVTR